MKITLKNEEIVYLNGGDTLDLPKYTSQIMNLANQNAQGTRPKNVGQLSDLFPEYENQTNDPSISEWKTWYSLKYPEAINAATEKVYNQVLQLNKAIILIDKSMVHSWVEDLIISKTFNGLYLQKAILTKMAEIEKKQFRLSTPEEEAQGIDGYLDDEPVSIKPDIYQHMNALSEVISVKMIVYTKKKDGIVISY